MTLSFKLIVFFILMLWIFLIFVEWLIPINQHLLIAIPFLEKTFSLVCHQQENKLLVQNAFHSLVCSRCAGIYVGLIIMSGATIFYTLRKSLSRNILFYSMIPMLADILCYSTGLYNYSKTVSFITGLLLGSTGFLYFYSAINQYLKEKRV